MSLSVTQARDEIIAMAYNALQSSSYAGITCKFEDVVTDQAPTSQNGSGDPDPWVCIEVQHVGGGQSSLGKPRARFTRHGLVFVKVYTPRGKGMSTADEIAQIVLDASEGQSSPGGVWFRNAQLRESGPDGIWTRIDVIVSFQYNEQK
jgi:hypothetical protein